MATCRGDSRRSHYEDWNDEPTVHSGTLGGKLVTEYMYVQCSTLYKSVDACLSTLCLFFFF